MLSATFGISTAIGPSLGGWNRPKRRLAQRVLREYPVALLALPVIARYLPHIVHDEGKEKSIDWFGALSFAISVSTLLLATEQGQMHGW